MTVYAEQDMAATKSAPVLHGVCRLLERQRQSVLSDRELLVRFARSRPEPAFAQLVARHGPLVAGVARRVVGDAHLAEDVLQATFLLLSQKARATTWQANIGPWLHQAAYRLACKARRLHTRHQRVAPEAALATA